MDNIKFSIIVPVYNVNKYLNKCLDSILNQTYDNFELLIIDDGSTDGSEKICDEYKKKDRRIKVFHKTNGGLSDARNYGVKHITGDYLLFIDSDDYIEKFLLEKLNEKLIVNLVDIIRFGCCTVNENYELLYKDDLNEVTNIRTKNIVSNLVRNKFVEPACLYCYNTQFYLKNDFKFSVGRVHEDLGLIPLVISESNNITILNYVGYYYLQREGSITKTYDYQKLYNGCHDVLNQFLEFIQKVDLKKFKGKVLTTYFLECVIQKSNALSVLDQKQYILKLKKIKFLHYYYPYNIKKFIKKIILFVDIKLYLKIFK